MPSTWGVVRQLKAENRSRAVWPGYTLSISRGRTWPSTMSRSSLGTMFIMGLPGGITPPRVWTLSPMTLPSEGATIVVRCNTSDTALMRSRVSNHSCCAAVIWSDTSLPQPCSICRISWRVSPTFTRVAAMSAARVPRLPMVCSYSRWRPMSTPSSINCRSMRATRLSRSFSIRPRSRNKASRLASRPRTCSSSWTMRWRSTSICPRYWRRRTSNRFSCTARISAMTGSSRRASSSSEKVISSINRRSALSRSISAIRP